MKDGTSRSAALAAGAIVSALVAAVPHGALAMAGPVVIAAVAAVLARRSRTARRTALALGAALVAGRALLVPWLDAATPAGDRRAFGRESAFEATVVRVHGVADGEQRAVLLLRSTDGMASDTDPGFQVWADLPRYPPVASGDRLQLRARVEPLPAGTPFGAYLERAGVVALARVRSVTSARPASGPLGVLEQARGGAGDALAVVLPAPHAGLAAGILLGLRERVDRSVAREFTDAGLSHVVAISGWNIALVAGVLAVLLRRVPRRPRGSLILLAIAVYTLFTGASTSVLRAATMAAVVILARDGGRPGSAAAALAVAVLAMLLVEPATVLDPGFQLSVAATGGLLAWATPITARLRRVLPSQVPGWVVEALGVSLAAQAATLPLVLLSFARLSLVSVPANLLVAPFVAPAMATSLVACVAGVLVGAGIPAALGTLAGTIGWASLAPMVAVGHLASRLPFASVTLPAPLAVALAALLATAILVAGTPEGRAGAERWRERWRRRVHAPARRAAPRGRGATSVTHRTDRFGVPAAAAAGRGGARGDTPRPDPLPRVGAVAVAALGAFLVLVAATRPDGRLRLTVLDVGQGDAILLEGDRGARVLVDGGPDPDRLLALLDARLPPWDRRIDLVVLTHPHEDHAAGLPLLLERYRVGGLAEPGTRGRGPGYTALRSRLDAEGRRPRRLFAGDTIRADSASIAVRWPRRGEVPAEAPDQGRALNNVSIVLDVRYGERRLLLTGDVEEEVDDRLIVDGLGADGRIDVLKVAHHGSGTATTHRLLAALRPRVAIVSAGADNRYGHPSPATLARLADAGARTYRTDRDGSVTVTTDGRSLDVGASGPRAARAPGGAAVVPRIARWPFPTDGRAPVSSSSSILPPGSSGTSPRSPRSPRSSALGSALAAGGSTSGSSRPPDSSTTSISCSIPITPSAAWATDPRAPPG